MSKAVLFTETKEFICIEVGNYQIVFRKVLHRSDNANEMLAWLKRLLKKWQKLISWHGALLPTTWGYALTLTLI